MRSARSITRLRACWVVHLVWMLGGPYPVRPAATAVIVAGLLDPAWLVEIEAEAIRDA